MKTLLAIGDLKDWDSYKKFIRQKRYFRKHNIKVKTVTYDNALEGKLPKAESKEITIFYFFPFDYWDKYIETKTYSEVYGNKFFYIKFRKFWKKVNKKIKDFYHDKKITYINKPEWVSIDRDKETTKKILVKNGLQVAHPYFTRDINKILRLLEYGKKLFVKVRYGSMGKGITYLEKDRWLTNFRFRQGKIISKKSDYGWTFLDITNNKRFLKILLKEDIIIEEAINPWLLKGRKFDIRLYVCFGKVLHVYPRSNDCEEVTTNISQGARGEGNDFIKSIPNKLISLSVNTSIKAARAMNLNFAGVDIMPNSDGDTVTVIEVNTFPGFPKMKSFNLSRYIIKEIAGRRWN